MTSDTLRAIRANIAAVFGDRVTHALTEPVQEHVEVQERAVPYHVAQAQARAMARNSARRAARRLPAASRDYLDDGYVPSWAKVLR